MNGDGWISERLVCPRDHTRLAVGGDRIVCREGHEYPLVDGIPVLVLEELEPTQPGYWAKPEQIAAVRSEQPQTAPADGIDPYVADLILGTHGNLYRRVPRRLPRYPIPPFPLAGGAGRTLLDIGCNWGRWTLAADRAGFDAVGIDPSFEAIAAAARIAAQLGASTRYAVADARALPFADAAFDVAFSYGVLQHFSKADAGAVLREVARVVTPGGETWMQMANALGLRNAYQLARRRFREGDRFEVRYWTPRELRRAWEAAIGPTQLTADGFFTLNPQSSDLDLLPAHARALVRVSTVLRSASGRVGVLTTFADSVSVRAVRR
jgi:SAM-dependent methyltransferase/uncharacterized protein YbaR (Trm112 family)